MHQKKKVVGTLLPLFALQKPDFISAQTFLTWLKKTKQSAWLLLPLHETQLETDSKTKHVPSPYKSYGIGLDSRYLPKVKFEARNSKEAFLKTHKEWIHDYSLFCALRDHFGTDDWITWEASIRSREEDALKRWSEKLAEQIANYMSQQWCLHEAHAMLHKKAAQSGIALIGDLPFYPSFRSPLVWAHQSVFQIEPDGKLPFVSGIPNSQWSHFGRQVWGHPLYNWEKQQNLVIEFWKMRLRYLGLIFDDIRFDHAKAFFAYGAIDIVHSENDSFRDGPGAEVFKELVTYAQKQGLTIFAEDSGEKTIMLRETMKEMHIAGLRIFRFAMTDNGLNPRYADLPAYPAHCVAYTSTHDTESLLGYIQTLTEDQKHMLAAATKIAYTDDKSFARALRNAVIASPAETVIIPMQDWLLTTERINVPGTEKEKNDTNWHYKLPMSLEDLPTEL